MRINLEKHLGTVIKEVMEAVAKVEKLQKTCDDEYLLKVLNQAIEWYETQDMLGYSFFRHAMPTDQSQPASFYSGLCSFLINTCLDDSCFAIRWEKYDLEKGWVEGEAWKDSPYVVWSHDDDPASSIRSEDMWKAIVFAKEQEEERERRMGEFEERMREIKEQWGK